MPQAATALEPKDFTSDQEVRWCPGCGDYSILKQVQKVMPELGIPRENIVFVSGIGCSSRFPYYMNTYGFHSIHGRAPAIATGLKIARPELSVWVVTGDGDGLSIGGNHLIHLLRRNLDINVLLFNNRIYGLTKGQYSPTSERGKITKSTPAGSLDAPFQPLSLALGADASFVARSVDVEAKHLQSIVRRAFEHRGTSFVEILQNCNIFNDGAFESLTERSSKADHQLVLEHGKPLVFGPQGSKGLRLNGLELEVVDLASGEFGTDQLLVHDEANVRVGRLLAELGGPDQPTPLGVLHAHERPTYEDLCHDQIAATVQRSGRGDLESLFHRGDTWTVS